MPFYAHPTGVLPNPELHYSFAVRRSAIAWLEDVRENNPTAFGAYTVSYHATLQDQRVWRDREQTRLETGRYLAVPWADQIAYGTPAYFHYAHLSAQKPGLIAYTPSDEHGIEDRKTTVRPGRYLQQFFPHWPKSERDAYIALVQTAFDTPLQLATTPDDIVQAYETGPDSCMAGVLGGPKSKRWKWDSRSTHPCAAYGDSDFGLVYTGPLSKVSGRCIVRLKEKTYTRIYGDVARLTLLLAKHGYTLGSIYGAHLRGIPEGDNGGFIAPYVDGNCLDATHAVNHSDGNPREEPYVRPVDGGTRLLIQSSSVLPRIYVSETWIARNCKGFIGDPLLTRTRCHECGDYTSYDDATYCDSCCERCWTCAVCDTRYFDEPASDGLDSDGDRVRYCEDCAREQRHTCDCGERWIETELTPEQQRERYAQRDTEHCWACYSRYAYCAKHGQYDAALNDCPACVEAVPTVLLGWARAVHTLLRYTSLVGPIARTWGVLTHTATCRICVRHLPLGSPVLQLSGSNGSVVCCSSCATERYDHPLRPEGYEDTHAVTL